MKKNVKDILLKNILSPLMAVFITLLATGALGQNQKINESASKKDVDTAKKDMKAYADKGDLDVVSYVDVRIASETKLRDSQYSTIIGMLNILIENKDK